MMQQCLLCVLVVLSLKHPWIGLQNTDFSTSRSPSPSPPCHKRPVSPEEHRPSEDDEEVPNKGTEFQAEKRAELKAIHEQVIKDQAEMHNLIQQNHSLLLHQGKVEDIRGRIWITHKIQTKNYLKLFDDHHYRDPEPAAIIKLKSTGLVPQMSEVCSDWLFCFLKSSDVTQLKMYTICAQNNDDYFVQWCKLHKDGKTAAGRRYVDKSLNRKKELARKSLASKDCKR